MYENLCYTETKKYRLESSKLDIIDLEKDCFDHFEIFSIAKVHIKKVALEAFDS